MNLNLLPNFFGISRNDKVSIDHKRNKPLEFYRVSVNQEHVVVVVLFMGFSIANVNLVCMVETIRRTYLCFSGKGCHIADLLRPQCVDD